MRRSASAVLASTVLFGGIVCACGFGIDTEGLFDGAEAGPPDAFSPAETGAATIDASTVDSPVDSPVDTGVVERIKLVELSLGEATACARRANGTVICWGDGTGGRLGDGTWLSSSKPVDVRDLTDATQLSVGRNHACAVRATGAIVCWGQNGAGQLGDGTTVDARIPQTVVGLTDVTKVVAGADATCAITKAKTVQCWGSNGARQLGDGTDVSRGAPAAVPGVADVTDLVASAATFCALSKGEVYCWGDNEYGQAGRPTPPRTVETASKIAGLTGVTSLGGSGSWSRHVCAVLENGSVRCWGVGWDGRLGNGTGDTSSVPVRVAAIDNAASVTAGGNFSCALRKDGRIFCWGDNTWRVIGIGEVSTPYSITPLRSAESLTGVVQVAGGDLFACAIHDDGDRVSCWGSNLFGSLGRGTAVLSDVPRKVAAPPAASVVTGREHACALGKDGSLSCWGGNNNRQQADATFQLTGTPTRVSALGGATAIAAGDYTTCALFAAGEARCWGYGEQGGLGNGTTPYNSADAVVFESDAPILEIAPSHSATCARRDSKDVVCAGNNEDLQLGRTGDDSATPSVVVEVGGTGALTTVKRLFGGRWHYCALHENGAVSCWGWNGSGALGVPGPQVSLAVRVTVPAVATMALGNEHTCAVLTTGAVRCWGNNGHGQISGSGESGSSQRTPNFGGKLVKEVVAGEHHTCALMADETVMCWGRGDRGQLGTGTRTDSAQPVLVSALSGVKSLSARYHQTCARTGDDAVWCWGENSYGQLGLGETMVTGTAAPVVGY